MAITITELQPLKTYLEGVMNRADHHALNVNEIALAIAGAVVWKADGEIKVREGKNDNTANVLWFHVKSNRYVLAFNHITGNIELRDRSQKGNVLAIFNNGSSILEVKEVFSQL